MTSVDGAMATLIDSSPVVTNNLIARNGGGLNTSSGHLVLTNNTVVDSLCNGIYAYCISTATLQSLRDEILMQSPAVAFSKRWRLTLARRAQDA